MNTTEKKLADLIREHPNLYDQSRRDYKDNLKGHLSWRDIADGMGKSEEEVKLKWKNLRDKFCKAKKRLAKRTLPLLTDDENQVERPVPVLYNQLAWLSAYVKPKVETGTGEADEGAGSGDDVEKEQDKDEKEQHCPMPVVTTSFSLVESSPNNHQEMGVSLKRKRQTETEISSADALANLRDEDELFLLSLLPSLKRLTIKKRMEVRMKFQQVLYAAEFDG
ncbi:Transcription factor Adf-1 [Liparis tanakae]|uniref:Transcription factor Adf-1 n=1 Tax=Liparis tanakae TaxID=230148 RepID=A0A4Z2GU52_9TELE|nr:Transcription factor Adf-1 [Liparis tanakae]